VVIGGVLLDVYRLRQQFADKRLPLGPRFRFLESFAEEQLELFASFGQRLLIGNFLLPDVRHKRLGARENAGPRRFCRRDNLAGRRIDGLQGNALISQLRIVRHIGQHRRRGLGRGGLEIGC
jgi:hypothetical protein